MIRVTAEPPVSAEESQIRDCIEAAGGPPDDRPGRNRSTYGQLKIVLDCTKTFGRSNFADKS